jgi:lipid-A-disaccharide synthase
MKDDGPMQIFFSVGEPSGDVHGANLIRALKARRPDVECVGFGGPLMAAAGCRLHADLTSLAVMGVVRVLGILHRFLDLASKADRYFRHHRPDAVVLIDFPGFNWWIAWRAKAHGIPVFYYVPPQLWGWLSYRVKKMRRYVDHVLCALPFEQKWFAERGCNATFVGHPFFDEVRRQPVDDAFLATMRDAPGPLVTLLPGSRTQEVESNLPWFLETAKIVRAAVPEARFAVAAFKPHQAQRAEKMVARAGIDVPVFLRRTPELIRAADVCLACSGSVSLELLHSLKPTVIGYRIARRNNFLQNMLRNVPYITLVNLLSTGRIDRTDEKQNPPSADPRVLFPEYLSPEDCTRVAAGHLTHWLTDATARNELIDKLRRLRDEVGVPGASERAAEYVLNVLSPRAKPVPRPHYLPAPAPAATMTK